MESNEKMLKKIIEENNLNNSELLEIINYISNKPKFINDELRLLSYDEVLNYNEELLIEIKNIIPLIDLYDNNFIIFNISENKFQIIDISTEEIYSNLDSIKKYIEIIKKRESKMSLKREKLIKIVDNFYSKRSEYSANNDLMSLYLQTLNNLSEVLLNYECEADNRFVTYCRRDFLKQELATSLEREDYDQAFYDIIDYVKADTWISPGSVPPECKFLEIVDMDEEYKNSGIVCKQEQEIILSMIKDFKDLVEKN